MCSNCTDVDIEGLGKGPMPHVLEGHRESMKNNFVDLDCRWNASDQAFLRGLLIQITCVFALNQPFRYPHSC